MFFATGLFSIGGGLATLPFLYDMSTRTNWFTHHDIANMLAVSQSVPGAVGINISTFAGFHTAGIPGALLAALSLITPGLIIILFIARFLDAFHENRIVNSAFYGLRAASLGLIASVAAGIAIPIFINMDLRSTDSMLLESMYSNRFGFNDISSIIYKEKYSPDIYNIIRSRFRNNIKNVIT